MGTHTHTHTNTHTHTHMHIHRNRHTHKDTHIDTDTHTHRHTYTHTQTHRKTLKKHTFPLTCKINIFSGAHTQRNIYNMNEKNTERHSKIYKLKIHQHLQKGEDEGYPHTGIETHRYFYIHMHIHTHTHKHRKT